MTDLCARCLYFQVKNPFTSFKNDIGFINKLCDNLFVIDLIAGAKVIRFAGGRHKFNYGSGQRT